MRILIIEDEIPAATELINILKQLDPLVVIEGVLPTMLDVKQSLETYNGKIDLIFMDIQLQGENILETLPEFEIPAPIIFVSAYDDYLIDALQHTSLDYILKPINKEKIQKALSKYTDIKKHFLQGYDYLLKQLAERTKKTRSRILYKKGTDFHFCRIEDVAYFYSEFRLIFLVDFREQKHLTDIKTLNILEEELDTRIFYRANRKFIININAIKKFRLLDRVKLAVELTVKVPEEVIISQENAPYFKNWIASKGDPDI
ncbi:MAG: response regulator transcription factor [Chitinophagaceae bacterium]|nr:response regulator transcription factor [Chitinophagaceae bacterium]